MAKVKKKVAKSAKKMAKVKRMEKAKTTVGLIRLHPIREEILLTQKVKKAKVKNQRKARKAKKNQRKARKRVKRAKKSIGERKKYRPNSIPWGNWVTERLHSLVLGKLYTQ